MNSTTPQSAVKLFTPDASARNIHSKAKPTMAGRKPGFSGKQVMKEGESCSICSASDHKSDFCLQKPSTTNFTPSTANNPIPPIAPVPQQDFQLVRPRPAARVPICYPNGSVFREEMDLDTSHHSVLLLRGLPMTMRYPFENNRGMSDQKEDRSSCLTSLASLFACLHTPAQSGGTSTSARLRLNLIKPLPNPPGEEARQCRKPLLNITHVPLSSPGPEDPYLDVQRRAKGVRLLHIPGGLADEYFLPQGVRSQSAPARRIPLPYPARPLPTQTNNTHKTSKKSAPERLHLRPLLPLAPLPPYPIHEPSHLSSSRHWIPTLLPLLDSTHCADARHKCHTPPGPGIKIWTEKGPMVVELGAIPAKVLENVGRFSVVVWEELVNWEDTDEAREWGERG